MKKQCGTCKWWDRNNKVDHGVRFGAICNAPVPDSVTCYKNWMYDTEGQNCPAYEQIKTDGHFIV